MQLEMEASDFIKHGHSPNKVDFIVCQKGTLPEVFAINPSEGEIVVSVFAPAEFRAPRFLGPRKRKEVLRHPVRDPVRRPRTPR